MLGLSMAILRLNWDGNKPEGDGDVLIESIYAIFKFTNSLQIFRNFGNNDLWIKLLRILIKLVLNVIVMNVFTQHQIISSWGAPIV